MATTSTAQMIFNAFDRIVSYQGVKKQFNDDYWNSEIDPIITPLWNSAKDALELFVYHSDGTYLIQRSKYKRDHKTQTSKWSSYEFDPAGVAEYDVDALFTSLRDKFFDYKDITEAEYQKAVERKIQESNVLTWEKINLVRVFLLKDSDWTQLPDNELSTELAAQWLAYRKWIRDNPKQNAQGSEAQTANDVIFPITPTEYNNRKTVGLSDNSIAAYGQQGNDEDYLASTYHFWKLSSNSLSYFAQKMTTYLVLSTITQVQSEFGTIGRIEVAQYRTRATAKEAGIDRYTRLPANASAELVEATNLTDAEIEAKGEEWLETLIARIERGEI
jgi:hypothetical protein|tara:strand:- start:2905 stop:3897 length:993 start_codon:yes stop_codon:yes gene_type:complete